MILVTNDDGIHSKGIIVLAKALQEIGMFLSLPQIGRRVPLPILSPSTVPYGWKRLKRIFMPWMVRRGTASIWESCILPERPRLIVSGINKGGNLGDDITYSGLFQLLLKGRCWGFLRSPSPWSQRVISNLMWLPALP